MRGGETPLQLWGGHLYNLSRARKSRLGAPFPMLDCSSGLCSLKASCSRLQWPPNKLLPSTKHSQEAGAASLWGKGASAPAVRVLQLVALQTKPAGFPLAETKQMAEMQPSSRDRPTAGLKIQSPPPREPFLNSPTGAKTILP